MTVKRKRIPVKMLLGSLAWVFSMACQSAPEATSQTYELRIPYGENDFLLTENIDTAKGNETEAKAPASAGDSPFSRESSLQKSVMGAVTSAEQVLVQSNIVTTTKEELNLPSNDAAMNKALFASATAENDVDPSREELAENEPTPSPEELAITEDSTKSPEEIGSLVDEDSLKVEESFPLCEGTLYMAEWRRQFDAKWLAENQVRFKKRSQLKDSLEEARSQAFSKLLFPAFGKVDSDFPIAITDDVIKWIQYFQTRGRGAYTTWLARANTIVPMIHTVLEEQGLPLDLSFLAMIESGFSSRATSIAAAAGPWQFIPGTGRMYGLKINDYVDERRDPGKSTKAAAKYLGDLYAMFGDWHLAAASYNSGEGRVKRALSGFDEGANFFKLSMAHKLPNETRNYVPKIIAAVIIGKNPARFGFDVSEKHTSHPSQSISLARQVAISDLAKAINVDVRVLENLNPELRIGITPPASTAAPYALKVPLSTYESASKSIASLPEPNLYHRVALRIKRRESLAQFARRHGIPLAQAAKSNPGLNAQSKLRSGQVVVLPVKLGNGTLERLTSETKKIKSKKASFRSAKYGKAKLTKVAYSSSGSKFKRAARKAARYR